MFRLNLIQFFYHLHLSSAFSSSFCSLLIQNLRRLLCEFLSFLFRLSPFSKVRLVVLSLKDYKAVRRLGFISPAFQGLQRLYSIVLSLNKRHNSTTCLLRALGRHRKSYSHIVNRQAWTPDASRAIGRDKPHYLLPYLPYL